jgi:hypothetical protein
MSFVTRRADTVLSVFLMIAAMTAQAHAAPRPPELSAAQRESLRFRLQNLLNEQVLLVRNRRADESDIRRQEREIQALKIYERIPFQEDLPGLKENLTDSAKTQGLKLIGIRVTGRSPLGGAIPSQLYTDDGDFRLKPEQIVTTLRFRATVEGDFSRVRDWIASWRDEQLRLTEAEGDPRPEGAARNRWVVTARAFRFRDVKFPHLMARDPLELLPAWARREQDRFSHTEPLLWELVARIRDVAPEAAPLYRTREQFLLNDARISFFLSKAVPRK